jgi:3-isopropylmalate dehydrogenase
LSATLMLRESFGLNAESQWIEDAIDRMLEKGYRTADIAEPGGRVVSGSEFTAKIRSELQAAPVQHAQRSSGA